MTGRGPAPRRVVPPADPERALACLWRFLAVAGPSGRERRVAREVAAALAEEGVPRRAIRFDAAHECIPQPTETGNLVVDLPGTGAGPATLFVAHLDTVALCDGAAPRLEGGRVLPQGATALGGDDRAGVACLVHMVAELRRLGLPHPPLTLLFTVREESGAWGARCVARERLAGVRRGFNLDGPSPSRWFVGAVGGAAWEVEVTGRGAHAGLHPERGVSAPLVVAEALAAVRRRGWWGRIRRAGGQGTSNAGRFAGRAGGAVGAGANVVTDYVSVEGEARSHDASFIPKIVGAYRRAFEYAARTVRGARGEVAEVEFRSRLLYPPFRLPQGAPVTRFALERAAAIDLSPELAIANGGLDANWIVEHGVPTVTFGVGQREVHTADEWLDVSDFLTACRLAVALAAG